MTEINVLIVLLASAVALLGGYVALRRQSPNPGSREAMLVKRVSELEGTVSMLLQKLSEQDQTISGLRQRVNELERQNLRYELADTVNARPRRLLVAISKEADLELDLAAIRGSGLRVERILDVTKASLKAKLDRHRNGGNPVRFLHISAHGSPHGIGLSGDVADGPWLSEQLTGAEVVVLMCCRADAIGDLLNSIDVVITMREEITHGDAVQFTKVFWQLVGAGTDPEQAFYTTLDRVPVGVAEMAELHLG